MAINVKVFELYYFIYPEVIDHLIFLVEVILFAMFAISWSHAFIPSKVF